MRISCAFVFVAAVAAGVVPATVGDAAEATISASAEVTTATDPKVGIPVADFRAKVKK
jgi:ABC-type spermidine/putrescine transport system permease subunit I